MTRLLFGCIPASLHPCIPASLRFAVFVFTLIMSGALSDLKAQLTQCDPEADFTFASSNNCDMQFTESYNGSGTVVSRLWEFFESPGGQPNRSNLQNPFHSFRGTNPTKTVTHTIVLMVNGNSTTYTCTKTFTLCTESAECYFRYTVQNCSLTVHRTGTYTFAPGVTISVSAAPYTYIYNTSGNYQVTNSIFGQSCPRTISIGSCSTPPCCNAHFDGELNIECSVLRFNLTPECTSGTSSWALVSPLPCAKVIGPLATGAQLTNINTDIYPQVIVRHTYTCEDGTVISEDKAINVPPGVYIGESGQTRPLRSSILSLTSSRFVKNFIGLYAIDGTFANVNFKQNTYDGAGPLKGIGILQTLIAGIEAPNSSSVDDLQQVVYSTEQGFAGMFLRDIGSFNPNTSVLAIADQNIFTNLSTGISTQNTSLRMRRVARFVNIVPGPYVSYVSAAVRCWDETGGTYFVAGNMSSGVSDFKNSSIGVIILASALRTGIHIADNRMTGMETGVCIIALKTGTLLGVESSSRFKGICRNDITVDREFGQGVASGAGISLTTTNPASWGRIDVWENKVIFNHNGLDGFTGTAGIWLGAVQSLLEGATEVYAFRNRVEVRTGVPAHPNQVPGWTGVSGIALRGTRIRVSDNAPAAFPGAGIYITGGPISAGIFNGVRSGNYISCNEVSSTLTTGTYGIVSFSANNSTIVSNVSTGSEVGVLFEKFGNGTRFRCNTMQNNSTGLWLRNAAQIGSQVSTTEPSGNKWFNTTVGATYDASVMVNGSRFYYRPGIAEEYPPNSPLAFPFWFTPTIGSTPPNCIDFCGASIAPPQEELPGELDYLVAQNALQYSSYPLTKQWVNRQILYGNLLVHSELTSDPDMAAFKAAYDNTPMAALTEAQKEIGELPNIVIARESELAALADQIGSLEDSIDQMDEQMNAGGNIESLMVQRNAIFDSLETRQAQLTDLIDSLKTQMVAEAGILAAELSAVSPSNICESNYRTVLHALLLYALPGQTPPPAVLSSLQNIATQCYWTGGPAVHEAQELYYAFTGTRLSDAPCQERGGNSNGVTDRNKIGESNVVAVLTPNPAKDRLQVTLEGNLPKEMPTTLFVYDIVGRLQMQAQTYSTTLALDVSSLRSGTYWIRAEQAGNTLFSKPVSIQR